MLTSLFNRCHGFFSSASILSLLLAGSHALRAQEAAALKIYTAIEIEFESEAGKSYTLQGSVNLTNWTDIGNPVLGTGRTVNRIYSTRAGASVNQASYRLHVEAGPTNGYAPWSLAGARIAMDDSTATNSVNYVDDHSGHDVYSAGEDPFNYQYSRLSANRAQVERAYTPDRSEVLTYTYTAPGQGTWVREEFRQGELERRVLGVFRYLEDSTNSIPGTTQPPVVIHTAQPPAPPTALTGLVYYVLSGAQPDKLTFQTLTAGVEMPIRTTSDETENEVSPGGNTFSYTYQVLTTNTASLIVNFGYYGFGGDKNEYDLTYTDGPSGTFVRRIYRLGALYSTDQGAFSPYDVSTNATSVTNTPPVSTNAPPANPSGLTYTIQSGKIPERLVFLTSATGIEYDDSAPSEFSFTYQATGTNTFGLVVQFKPDRWHEYDLVFDNGAQGTYTRRQYKNNALDRVDTGTFTLEVTKP